MAEKVQIEITLAPDGTVHLDTKGLKGPGCLRETEALERALGRVVRRVRTGEYYQQEAAATSSVKER